MGTLRAFVSLRLDEAAQRAIEELVTQLQPLAETRKVRASWTREPHLTLVFLGNVLEPNLPRIQNLLEGAGSGIGPIRLTLEALGGFPNLTRPRVLWVGLAGETGKLAELQKRVAGALAQFGDHRELKPFNPHITIARINSGHAGGAREFFGEIKNRERERFVESRCEHIDLMRSHLSSRGARYEVLSSVRLEES